MTHGVFGPRPLNGEALNPPFRAPRRDPPIQPVLVREPRWTLRRLNLSDSEFHQLVPQLLPNRRQFARRGLIAHDYS